MGEGTAELLDDGFIEIEFEYHNGDDAVLKSEARAFFNSLLGIFSPDHPSVKARKIGIFLSNFSAYTNIQCKTRCAFRLKHIWNILL